MSVLSVCKLGKMVYFIYTQQKKPFCLGTVLIHWIKMQTTNMFYWVIHIVYFHGLYFAFFFLSLVTLHNTVTVISIDKT